MVIEFAGGKGLWCAERLGPDSIRASRPGYIGVIPEAPDDDFLFPEQFIATARELGWHGDGVFDVNKVYGDGKGRWDGVAWIEEEMRARAMRSGKIAPADIFWAISTPRLTGDTAGYGQLVPLVHPADPALRVMWHAPIGPSAAPLVPVFMGQTAVPAAHARHRYLTTGEAHRFQDMRNALKTPDAVSSVPQGIEVADSAVYQFKRLMHLAFQDAGIFAEVDAHWRRMEDRLRGELPEVLACAETLISAGKPDQAARVLTMASTGWLDQAMADCAALVASAYVRLREAGTLNQSDRHMGPEQLW